MELLNMEIRHRPVGERVVRELFTTPEANRKPDIRAKTKRNMASAIVKQPQSY